MPAIAPLDEAWAVGYFQVAVSILIFGVGVPALVLQTVVPDDLRRIAYRHSLGLRYGIWWGTAFMIVALTFVWLLHPVPGMNIRLLPGVEIDQWLAAGSTSACVIGVGGVWYLYAEHRRDKVIDRITRRCINRIRSTPVRGHDGGGSGSGETTRAAVPDDTTLDDLRYLGEQASSRAEGQQVVEALQSLAQEVLRHPNYDGSGLEGIIRALRASLVRTNDSNGLADGIKALGNLTIATPPSLARPSPDDDLLLEALESLVQSAWKVDGDRAAVRILEAIQAMAVGPDGLKFEAELALVRVGVTALANERHFIAVDVLSRLERSASDAANGNLDARIPYVGLVAHFIREGGSARERALAGLHRVSFHSSRRQCLEQAKHFYYMHCRFDTADCLTRWLMGADDGVPETFGPAPFNVPSTC